MINMIVAMTDNHVIGKDNKLLWKIPGELKYFKEKTMGHPIIMGRKTYLSIGRPLPGRKNIVLTRNLQNQMPIHFDDPTGITIMLSVEQVLNEFKDEDIFIIGGAEIYKQFMPYADRLYITCIHQDFEGDAFFPAMGAEWKLISNVPGQGDIPHHYTIYERDTYDN